LLAILLVLLLDLLHLRRMLLQRLHRMDLPDRQRHEDHPHDDRRGHDRPGPRQADVRVEEVEDVLHHVLELAEDGDRGDDHRTGSNPPRLHGLHRSSRQPARALPLTRPWRRRDCTAYSEHDGWYLHVVGKRAPNVSRQSQTRPTPSSDGTRVTALMPREPRSA